MALSRDGIRQLAIAERAAAAKGNRLVQAWVHFNIADAHIEAAISGDDFEAARDYLFRGLELIGPEGPQLATGELRLGPPPEDLEALTKWRRLERELDARYLAYEHLTTLSFLEGDASSALRWSDRLVHVSEALEKPSNYFLALNFRASMLILDGQLEEGQRIFNETFEELKATKIRTLIRTASSYGARAHLSAGDLDKAQALALTALAPSGGSNVHKRMALEALVEIHKTRQEPEKALRYSEALSALYLSSASENGRLIRASFAAQQRSDKAELETRFQQAILTAAALGLTLLLGSCAVLFLRWKRSVRDARASRTVGAVQRTLNRELRHRFGNHLATLRAAVEPRGSDEPAHRLDRIRQSIEAMSALDAVISDADEHPDGVELGVYLETLLSLSEEIYAPRADLRWSVDAELVRLEPKRAFLVGLAVAEAVNNAFRHGFGAAGTGMVQVSVKRDGADVVVATEDDGEGLGQSPRRDGNGSHQGLSILEDMSRYLCGSLELASARPGAARPGLRVTLRMPITTKRNLEAPDLRPAKFSPALNQG